MADSLNIADETEPRSSDRSRKYTEKGLEWQLEQRVHSIRTLITRWNASAERLSILLSDIDGKIDIQVSVFDERDQLVSFMRKLREEGEQYRHLLDSDKSHQNLESLKIIQNLDRVETEHHKLIMTVTEPLCEVKDKISETGSKTSRTSHRSSKLKVSSTSRASSSHRTVKSRASTRSSQSNIAAEAASLKIKLKYLEAESKAKLEFDRIRLQKGLDLAQVSLEQYEEETLLSCIDKLDRTTGEGYTAKYILAHSNPSQTDTQDIKREFSVTTQNSETATIQNQVPLRPSSPVCTSNGVSIHDRISYVSVKTENSSITYTTAMNPAAKEFFPNSTVAGNIASPFEHNSVSPRSKINVLPSSVAQHTTLPNLAQTTPYTEAQQAVRDLPATAVYSATQVSTSSTPVSCHTHPLAATQQTVHEPSHKTNLLNEASSNGTNVTSEQTLMSLVKSLTDQVNLGRLPAPEPSVFTGDPLKYPGWKVDFTMLIEQRKIPSAERIHYLKKYLGGIAKEAVENFFLVSSDYAYDEAKKLLDERFGDAFIVGNAFRDKLEKWPKIAPRDCDSLQRFSDFVKQCQTAMSSIGTLKCLDDDRENRKFLSKLPDWIVTRWSRTAYQWKEEKKEFPPFKIFADFLSKEAKIACNPVISLQSLKSDKSQAETRPRPTKTASRSFLTAASGGQTSGSASAKAVHLQCLLCKGSSHELNECKTYLSKPLSERKAFTRENNLCFGCLRGGHISKRCRNRKRCSVCSKFHPTSLHGDIKTRESQQTGLQNNPSRGSAMNNVLPISQPSVSLLSSSSACNKNSTIVPVYLSHKDRPDRERLIYAMLDTQSDCTFVLEDTCKSLEILGAPVSLALSTMHASNRTIESRKVSDLVVRGINSLDKIALPPTFSIEAIPANKAHIPTPEVAKSWPHLRPIADHIMPIADCEIGLLIGYNCARAMMPREVIPPDGEGPYGQRTDLGWSIVGVVNSECVFDDYCVNHCVSHRVATLEVPSGHVSTETIYPDRVSFAFKSSTKILCPTEINRMFELDFSERNPINAMLSAEDQRFLSLLKQTIRFENGHYVMPLPFSYAITLQKWSTCFTG